MRRALPILLGLSILAAGAAQAVPVGPGKLLMTPAPPKGERDVDVHRGAARADTMWYGDYQVIDGVYYARRALNGKSSVMWTFDRGNGPHGDPNVIENGEGWSSVDLTTPPDHYFRVIDNALRLCDATLPPIIDGAKSLWVGADYAQAGALCWNHPCGYGNNWCQRVSTPPLPYDGTGDVTLSFKYFNQSEPCFDGTQVYLKHADDSELLLNPWQGNCPANPDWVGQGGFTDSIGSWQPPGGGHPGPAVFTRVVTHHEIGGAQDIRFVIEFKSDAGNSDEDGPQPPWTGDPWGPFGCDDVAVNGGGIDVAYDFENGLAGWTPLFCSPVGSYAGIVDVGCYTILDPCGCRLSENVLKMHAGECNEGYHPPGQWEYVESPICDDSDNHNLKTIFYEFDMYADLPQDACVLFRPGWKYYPFTCDVTGQVGWSGRVGIDAEFFMNTPGCMLIRAGGTDLETGGSPVPPTAQKFIAIFELHSDCAAFAITHEEPSNFTPLLDNFRVGVTANIQAPVASFDTGDTFVDVGSYDGNQGDAFNPRMPGPANTRALFLQDPAKPDVGGDSLVIAGPQPTNDPNTRWEGRMWWRVGRRAPFQSDLANGVPTTYKQWKTAVSKGLAIDRPDKPQFTWGSMDSAQLGPVRLRYKFLSAFREDDPSYNAAGEATRRHAMLWDDVFFPGTRIDYFCTTDFVVTPNILYYMPDTTGGNYMEFEVLPGCRTANVPDDGGAGFDFCVYHPAILYIDAFGNATARLLVEDALRTVLNGLPPCADPNGCAIPPDRNWDRFDYTNSASNFETAFARGSLAGSNAGMTLGEILGYRAILLATGRIGAGDTRDVDYQLFNDWLVSGNCNANTNRQVFLMNGDQCGGVLNNTGPNGQSFLNNTLGATRLCDAFNGITGNPNCGPPDTTYCLRYLPVQGGPFTTDADVDAYGSWCPNQYSYNFYGTSGTGVGNRYFQDEPPGTKQGLYAQVANANLAPTANYKTVIDGASWHHMTQRNPGGAGMDRCPRDLSSIVSGEAAEIGAALKWGFDAADYGGIPRLVNVRDLATCEGTWNLPAGAGDQAGALVNRLYQNEPNPFGRRSSIRFSLARSGPVQILIYDVNGRLVRTLVDGKMDAGTHQAVWDGTNNLGRRVGSGVFWSQMRTSAYVSNKKVVILR